MAYTFHQEGALGTCKCICTILYPQYILFIIYNINIILCIICYWKHIRRSNNATKGARSAFLMKSMSHYTIHYMKLVNVFPTFSYTFSIALEIYMTIFKSIHRSHIMYVQRFVPIIRTLLGSPLYSCFILFLIQYIYTFLYILSYPKCMVKPFEDASKRYSRFLSNQ